MGIDWLKQPILYLSRGEKMELIRFVEDSMTPGVLTGSDRYLYVLSVAESVLGWKLTPQRSAHNTLIRAFVAYRLHGEGYSTTNIGGYMGRNHSSVLHLIRRMEDILSLPGVYREETTKYKDFESML